MDTHGETSKEMSDYHGEQHKAFISPRIIVIQEDDHQTSNKD